MPPWSVIDAVTHITADLGVLFQVLLFLITIESTCTFYAMENRLEDTKNLSIFWRVPILNILTSSVQYSVWLSIWAVLSAYVEWVAALRIFKASSFNFHYEVSLKRPSSAAKTS